MMLFLQQGVCERVVYSAKDSTPFNLQKNRPLDPSHHSGWMELLRVSSWRSISRTLEPIHQADK